jgi:hypothetical protein
LSAPDSDNIPAEVLDRVLDAVLAIEARLARLEERRARGHLAPHVGKGGPTPPALRVTPPRCKAPRRGVIKEPVKP